MSRLVLGIGFVCLFAAEAMATGFVIPRLPDFELQRGYGHVTPTECIFGPSCVAAAGSSSKADPAVKPHGRKPTSAATP